MNKLFFRIVILLTISCMCINEINAQNQYTKYDNLPGINTSYKPSYSKDFPDWGKMLYKDHINFNNIESSFKSYILEHKGEKSAIIRYYKIWRRVASQYALPDGTIKIPDLNDYYSNLRRAQTNSGTSLKSSSSSNANWTFLGPKQTFWLNEQNKAEAPSSCPWQVNIYSFDVSASNNNVIYAGTETGLLNKSVDKGLTWKQIAYDYPFGGGVSAVAVHPTNENIVYASAGSQIHKTTDGGTSWTPLLTSTKFSADRLIIDKSNPQKLIAATNYGIYISSNAGDTWQQKWSKKTWDVEIKPDDSNTIYGITETSDKKFSIVRSNDGGNTFAKDNTFPGNITQSSGGLLAVTADNPDIIFSVMLSNDNTPYLYKGTLNNNTWSWVKKATGKTSELEMNNGQGYFDLVIEVSPNDENLVFVGTTTLFKSTNGGSNFSVVGGYWGKFSIHPDIQDMKMLPNGETWVATDGGMNFTTDNFTNIENWTARINGIVGSDMWGFDQGWNEDIIVGGRYHNGNTAIADFYEDKALRMGGAESPTGWILKGKSRHVAFNDLGSGWILPKTAEGAPEGRFLFSKFPNMDEYGGRRSNILHHPNYSGILYVGEGNSIWISHDFGQSYDLLKQFQGRVLYMDISFKNPDVIYVDIAGKGLYKTSDGGKTWSHKPSLTNGSAGNSNWNGKLFFAISPYNENVIYACLQNGTWSSDIGKIFKSTNGGDSWSNITGSVSEYTKNIVIQPTNDEKDLLYLFTTSKKGKAAKVYYRKDGMSDWAEFNTNYPAGMSVNIAIPFFRDSKIRVGGSASVWESPLQETDFKPILNPWVQKKHFNCMNDTLYFDDHSMINHSGATWEWEITPTPAYISNTNIRNPKVVLGAPGDYNVKMKVTKDGNTYSKTIKNMVTTTTCPSITDCSNPAELPKSGWKLVYADSEETGHPGLAKMAFDGDPSTIWHTRWSSGTDNYPHEIQVDLGIKYDVHQFTYLPRQSGQNGRIKKYKLYISDDKSNWKTPVKTGEWPNSAAPQKIKFSTPIRGQYFRLVAESEVNDNAWSSIAELTIIGCEGKDNTDGGDGDGDGDGGITDINYNPNVNSVVAYPIPSENVVNLKLPLSKSYRYKIYSISGRLVDEGTIEGNSLKQIDLSNLNPGVFFIHMTNAKGTTYRTKVIKK